MRFVYRTGNKYFIARFEGDENIKQKTLLYHFAEMVYRKINSRRTYKSLYLTPHMIKVAIRDIANRITIER